MNVKTRIAAFESQNEEVRRIATPTRALSPGASPNSGFGRDNNMFRSNTPRSAASSPANSDAGGGGFGGASAVLAAAAALRPTSKTRTTPTTAAIATTTTAAAATSLVDTRSNTGSAVSSDHGFTVIRHSTGGTSSTMAASEIRKTRLARSVSSNASVASEPPPGSLMERRKQIKESRLRQQRSPVVVKNTASSLGEAYSKRRNNGSLTPTRGNSPVRSAASSNNVQQHSHVVLQHHLSGTTNHHHNNMGSVKSKSVHPLTVPALSVPSPVNQKAQPGSLSLTPQQQQQRKFEMQSIKSQPSQPPSTTTQFNIRLRPTPKSAAALHSHRRFVHSISAESDDSNRSHDMAASNASVSSSTSLQKRHPAQLAKRHRMQRMKRNNTNDHGDIMANMMTTHSMPSLGSDYDEEFDDVDYDTNEEGGLENPPSIQRVRGNASRDGTFLPASQRAAGVDAPMGGSVSGVTTDDEATLTSVRRIVMESEARQEEYSADLLRDATPTKNSGWPNIDDDDNDTNNNNNARRGMSPPTTNTRDVFGEEKSDKAGAMLRTSSSSDYDSDQDGSPFLKKQQLQQQQQQQANSSIGQQMQQQQQRQQPPVTSTTDWTEIPDVNGFFSRSRSSGFVQHSLSNRAEDDESYGDNLSPSSMSYAERMRREERKKKAGATKAKDGTTGGPEGVQSPLLNKDDFEHFRQQMDNSSTKIAAGVIGCAVAGCLVLGPVGLLLGPAAVGIGFGFMQIPEEQRNNMRDKAAQAFESAQQSALNASDTISQSCAVTYKDSGVAQHIPSDMSRCFTSTEDTSRLAHGGDDDEEEHNPILSDNTGEGPLGTGKTTAKGIAGGSDSHVSPPQSKIRNQKVACLRTARIVPVNQIHALDPSAQPKAWLDVLACASTTDDEKLEAMEEILILAKDKRRARIFLEEGILDSMMWILGRYFEKVNRKPTDVWSKPDISSQESNSAKLAAACCVTLGKAHCASMHTDGDLLLMSLYERGTVPEERQLAQMLFEIPHHARVTKTSDPTFVEPTKEVFALKQLTLPQAEELARNIKALADGNQMSMIPQTNNHPTT